VHRVDGNRCFSRLGHRIAANLADHTLLRRRQAIRQGVVEAPDELSLDLVQMRPEQRRHPLAAEH